MQVWQRKATGRLLSALLLGLVGAASSQIGIQAYRHLGWSLFGCAALGYCILAAALYPLLNRIHRKYAADPNSSDTAAEGAKQER